MSQITLEEMNCFAKVFYAYFGTETPTAVSEHEKDLAIEALKKAADNRNNWTYEQKEKYKAIAEFVKRIY